MLGVLWMYTLSYLSHLIHGQNVSKAKFLRVFVSYEAKLVKICSFWAFWSVRWGPYLLSCLGGLTSENSSYPKSVYLLGLSYSVQKKKVNSREDAKYFSTVEGGTLKVH